MADTAAVASGVIEMLKEDHEKVKGLFGDFESAEGRSRRTLPPLSSWSWRSMLIWRKTHLPGYSEAHRRG